MSRFHLVLRAVLEARSPISIASGDTDPRYDVLLARDVNGLPILPSTSVAGSLRGIVASIADSATADELFGCARSGVEGGGTVSSAVTVTGGLVHDSSDRPVDGVLLGPNAARLKDDALLAALLDTQPMKRDHVRISSRGVAEDTAKFDRAGVPTGTRFTIQLELATETRDDPRWELVSKAIVHPGFRLGGGTRNGYGAVAVIRTQERRFDLTERADLEALTLANRLDAKLSANSIALSKAGAASTAGASIRTALIPKDFWRYGADGTPRPTSAGEEPPHLVAVREAGIEWRSCGSGETGTLQAEQRYVLPGSSIKGALRHRTLFHLHRLHRAFENVDGTETDRIESEIATLFGRVDKEAQAGCLIVSDTAIDAGRAATATLWHNGIDRFSGGVRAGVLYGEELVFGGKLDLCIMLTDRAEVGRPVRQALRHALEDLAAGRLCLGAGAAKGHGVMTAPDMKAALDGAATWFERSLDA